MRIKLKKGLDLKIAGAAEARISDTVMPQRCALIPDDYPGLMPKPAVKEGEHVGVGDPVAYDKQHPGLKLVSPLSGVLKTIERGERRKIMKFVIEADGTADVHSFDPKSGKVAELLAESGLLAMMRTRPYDVVPDPEVVPRDIFVTCIYSAPLAVNQVVLAGDCRSTLAAAVKLLGSATSGRVYLSVDSEWPYGDIPGAEMVTFTGRHPVGNASVQIAAISPVNKGEVVWTLDFTTLLRVGVLAETGKYKPDTAVAITGPEVTEPAVVSTVLGAEMAPLLRGRIAKAGHHQRVISGSVLTGEKVNPVDGYLHYPYQQITVIAEGDDRDELLGWASLSPSKMSDSRSFPGHFLHRLFKPDARLLGGRRAMIMSGQYDKMIPMDIMPEYLIKAIIGRDIEGMENLGIYEVAPEDFALAEYADTSKLPLQKIVREGLDYLRKELE